MFLGFDHVDLRVFSLLEVEAFYDALMPALGLTKKVFASVRGDEWEHVDSSQPYNAVEYYEGDPQAGAARFMGVIECQKTVPTLTRVAFRVPDRDALETWEDRLREFGARNVERAADLETYPAIFFEDACGTKLEVCARRRPQG